MSATEERLLSLEDVANRLQVSDQSVRRWIKAGKLAAYKPGLEWRIRPSDLEEFLEARSYPKVQAPLPEADQERRRLHPRIETRRKFFEVDLEKWHQEAETNVVRHEFGDLRPPEDARLGEIKLNSPARRRLWELAVLDEKLAHTAELEELGILGEIREGLAESADPHRQRAAMAFCRQFLEAIAFHAAEERQLLLDVKRQVEKELGEETVVELFRDREAAAEAKGEAAGE